MIAFKAAAGSIFIQAAIERAELANSYANGSIAMQVQSIAESADDKEPVVRCDVKTGRRPGLTRFAFLGQHHRAPENHVALANDGVIDRMALLDVGKELRPQPIIQDALGPDDMHRAVRPHPEVAGHDPAAGLVPAGDFHPGAELLARDVRRPRVEQAAEIVVPFLAGKLLFVGAPFRVRLDNVADATEVHGAFLKEDVRIADPDGLRFGILSAVRPGQFALRGPLAFSVAKSPCGMGVTDVLQQD